MSDSSYISTFFDWVRTFMDWSRVYGLILSIVAAIISTKKLWRFWRTRHLRKVWGIKNGDDVSVVCSELIQTH